MHELKERVLSKIKPSDDEYKRMRGVASEIIDRIEIILKDKGLENVNIKMVGSAARGTWLTGSHDLDIFISFPTETKREELEELGLSVGREVATEAEKWDEHYAEHPYVKMVYKGFNVDLVPCYNVPDASQIISAVDRTPFHNEFIKAHINGLQDDVLLLKQFMKGGGVYGSELKTGGFSGYLTELITIKYGGFEKVLEAAADWKPGLIIDIKNHSGMDFEEPLVVIDPTDPKRNVAAALTLDRFCEFIHLSRKHLQGSDEKMFFPLEIQPLERDIFVQRIKEHGTCPVSLAFDIPEIVEDIFYPQFYKMEQSIRKMIEKHDFVVIKTGTHASEKNAKAYILIELSSSTLPNIKIHQGPPVWVRSHAEKFLLKYRSNERNNPITIKNGFYMVEIERKYKTIADLLNNELSCCSLGKHISQQIKQGYDIYLNEEVYRNDDEQLKRFLNRWFH